MAKQAAGKHLSARLNEQTAVDKSSQRRRVCNGALVTSNTVFEAPAHLVKVRFTDLDGNSVARLVSPAPVPAYQCTLVGGHSGPAADGGGGAGGVDGVWTARRLRRPLVAVFHAAKGRRGHLDVTAVTRQLDPRRLRQHERRRQQAQVTRTT